MNSITQSRLRELLHYDEESGLFTWLVKGSIRTPAGSKAGTVNSLGYVVFRVDGCLYYAHRLAWMYVHGEFPEHGVDHKDGIRSNNAIANLRPATQSQNMQNLKFKRVNSKLPIGVGFYKRYGRWTARIQKDRESKFLGYFDSQEAAHQAYLAAKAVTHDFNPIARGMTQ